MSKSNVSLHEALAEKIIKKLEEGTAPWQLPWDSNGSLFELPYNALTGNRYRGINSLSLLLAERQDPRWMTYKQAASNDWQVRKGEKGTRVQFVKTHELVAKRDERGRPVLDELNRPVKVRMPLNRVILTSAWVFNAEQIEGIAPLLRVEGTQSKWKPLERAENLIQASGASINHTFENQAYYNPASDQITLPQKEQFAGPDKYYATLLHELGHWTGHQERLDRNLVHRFGTEEYAREELRAEIASMLIGQELQIGHDPNQHVAYVDSWIKLLKDFPFEIHAAATDAEKIFNYLLAFEQKREIKAGAENELDPSRIKSIPNESIVLPAGQEVAFKEPVSSKEFAESLLSKKHGSPGSSLNKQLDLSPFLDSEESIGRKGIKR